MRPGMQSLLRVARDQPQPSSHTESEWMDLLALAEQENVLPWVAARLSCGSIQVPGAISASVAAIRRIAIHHGFAWSAALKHMLAAFHHRGIPVISLKGPWLAERLYGDVASRAYSDLDLLVRPSDWSAVEIMLAELGFSPVAPSDGCHRRWRRAGIDIEPHFRLHRPHEFPGDTNDLWNRAQLSEFRGVPAWRLAASDELLFLCTHAFRHCFERMSLLLDLAAGFRQFPLPSDMVLSQCGPEAHSALVLSWMMAARLESAPPLPSIAPDWIASRPHLKKIADQMWQRCMSRPGCSDWRTSRRLFVDIERPGWRKSRRWLRYAGKFIRVVFTSLAREDLLFARRFHLRHPWQARILRPFRLLVKHFCAPALAQRDVTLINPIARTLQAEESFFRTKGTAV